MTEIKQMQLHTFDSEERINIWNTAHQIKNIIDQEQNKIDSFYDSPTYGKDPNEPCENPYNKSDSYETTQAPTLFPYIIAGRWQGNDGVFIVSKNIHPHDITTMRAIEYIAIEIARHSNWPCEVKTITPIL